MSNPVEIRPGIWWVGVIDRESLNIHGQITGGGTTYNAYLILDEHPTLIDTVKAPFADELIENITKVIDPLKIDYVVSNHGEPDHSGSIPAVCKACKNATLYSTAKKGLKFLEGEYHEGLSLPTVGVKTGDTLELGKHTLTFVETPMVHWPDNMVTYCADEKILFSNDAFGQHYATDERYDDEVPFDMLMRQVEIYYANIVEPFNRQVKATLAKVAGLDIDLIAPAHGVMWRSHIADIVAKYDDLANDRHGNDAVICYDSMWDSTEKMAAAIAAGFESAGIATHVYDLKEGRFSDALADLLNAGYVCVGSPTRNNTMLPNVAYFLCDMKGLFGKNDRKALAFGSYGWAPTGPKEVNAQLEAIGYETLMEPITMNWVPTDADLRKITDDVAAAVQTA